MPNKQLSNCWCILTEDGTTLYVTAVDVSNGTNIEPCLWKWWDSIYCHFNFKVGHWKRTWSHTWDRWYMLTFLLRVGWFTLMYMESLRRQLKFYSFLVTIARFSIVVSCPVSGHLSTNTKPLLHMRASLSLGLLVGFSRFCPLCRVPVYHVWFLHS